MYWESALSSTVEVGIGLVGFSGIIAALRAGRGTWSEADRLSLQILLGASGWAILFSLIPFVALDFLPSGVAWNVLSFVYAAVFVSIASFRLLEFRSRNLSKQAVARIVLATGSAALVLVANGCLLGAAWIYVCVVIWQLWNAFRSFVQLLQLERMHDDDAA